MRDALRKPDLSQPAAPHSAAPGAGAADTAVLEAES
jgi:hypothetical protein